MNTFRFAAQLSTLVCVILFGFLLVAPGTYSGGYGVPEDAGGVFLGNRAAPLFLGLATICWLLRDTTVRDVRVAVSLGMIVTYLGIASTGVLAYLQGVGSATLLLAAVGEAALAMCFVFALRKET